MKKLAILNKIKIGLFLLLSFSLISTATYATQADEEKDLGDIHRIKPETYDFSEETLKKFPFIKKDFDNINHDINDGFDSKDDVSFEVFRFNIDKEKKEMLFFYEFSRFSCGTHGCSTDLLEKNKDGTYKLIDSYILYDAIFQIACPNKFSLVTFGHSFDKPYYLWEYNKGTFKFKNNYPSMKDIPQCK